MKTCDLSSSQNKLERLFHASFRLVRNLPEWSTVSSKVSDKKIAKDQHSSLFSLPGIEEESFAKMMIGVNVISLICFGPNVVKLFTSHYSQMFIISKCFYWQAFPA
jgi:hypothetical protein